MNCEKCDHPLEGQEAICPNCGTFISYQSPATPTQTYGEVPAEIKKWTWGALVFNMFWGIGNHSYLPLLCLIPIFNIVWIFVCGAKGNEWAWKSGKFDNLEHFLAIQETWNRAGLVSFIITAAMIGLYLLMLLGIIALSL
ncbi:MAG: hypothetical protein ACRCW2_04720 [Cellulosilyticaceae bacterium]